MDLYVRGLWRYPVKTLAGEPVQEPALNAEVARPGKIRVGDSVSFLPSRAFPRPRCGSIWDCAEAHFGAAAGAPTVRPLCDTCSLCPTDFGGE